MGSRRCILPKDEFPTRYDDANDDDDDDDGDDDDDDVFGRRGLRLHGAKIDVKWDYNLAQRRSAAQSGPAWPIIIFPDCGSVRAHCMLLGKPNSGFRHFFIKWIVLFEPAVPVSFFQ